MINLDNNRIPLSAINMLLEAGYEAGFVGGCVRDAIMNKKCNDFDITTSAKPEEIKKVFSMYKTLDIGIKHGTVVVIIDKELIEITTFRIDGDYGDGRHPDKVSYTNSLVEDLKRRDFTQNAIFYNTKEGIVDPFHGLEDIKNKIIRTVGNPDLRFNEDGLRIMRCIRFSSCLSFAIENNTKKSLLRNIHLLDNISIERITTEFLKLIIGDNFYNVMTEYRDIIGYIIPETKETFDFDQCNPYHKYDIYTHILHSMENVSSLKLRLVMLFHDIGKPYCFHKDEKGIGHFYNHAKMSASITDNIFKRMKITIFKDLTKEEINDILLLIKYHDIKITGTKRNIKKIIYKLGGNKNLFLDLLAIKKADDLAKADIKKAELEQKINIANSLYNELKKEEICVSLKDLNINGNDLKQLGISGQKIGMLLNKLLLDVIDEKIDNTKETLISRAKILLSD